MFRKKPHEAVLINGSHWTETVPTTEPMEKGENLKHIIKVKDCSEICEEQLDPSVVNATTIVKEGIVINAGDTSNLLTPTDRADIEARNMDSALKTYKYVTEHETELKPEEPKKE